MGSGPFRRRQAWRQLGAGSYSAQEKRTRRHRMVAWGLWSVTVLIGMAILLAQNTTS
jgi:hypothetical protein